MYANHAVMYMTLRRETRTVGLNQEPHLKTSRMTGYARYVDWGKTYLYRKNKRIKEHIEKAPKIMQILGVFCRLVKRTEQSGAQTGFIMKNTGKRECIFISYFLGDVIYRKFCILK